MKLSRNEVYEALSCVLLVIMIAISFTYEKKSLFTVILVISCIGLFSVITYLSTDEHEKEMGLIKCESMLFCLCMMIYLYYQINMILPLILVFSSLFLTTSKELKKR